MDEFASVEAVRGVVARLANTIDTRRWTELRTLFADNVVTDYTSLFGGEEQRQSRDDLVGGWRKLLSPPRRHSALSRRD